MPNKSILLVDDEEIILRSVGMDLRHANYSVETASNGQKAIEMINNHYFNLVISDLSMPGLSGMEVLKAAKKKDPLTAVIILTGFGDMASAIEALRMGADDYLLKPCESDELIIRIKHCLEKQQLTEQLVVQNTKLAESEMQKTLLLNSAAEGIYGIDTQGKTTFINPAAEKMLGYTTQEIIHKNNHALIHHTKRDGSEYPESECKMAAAIKKGTEVVVTDELLWRKDGTSFPVEYSSTPIKQNNENVGAVIIFSDITKRKEREKRQIQTEKHFQQLQKYQSLTSMAAGIAHNFNNILMAVLGNQELALETMHTNSKERSYIEAAYEASKQAAKISTMMLQFVGQAKVDMQLLEVNELSHETIKILRHQIPPHIELSCKKGANQYFLKGDRGMVQQVIVNLVNNATEAINSEKGSITLGYGQKFFTEKQLKQPYIQPKLPSGEYVYFEIMDTGHGMNADEMARAFEPFFTTKFTGRGMGLASILGIMRTQSGTILLESNARGEGVTATVLFPPQIPLPQTFEKPQSTRNKHALNGTVLFVDDEEVLRDVGRDLLKLLGFKVILAANGIEALDLFEKNINEIDLVLLDFAMPRLNGHKTLKEIRKKSQVPAIMATGYKIEQIEDQFTGISNVNFLQKPFNLKTLEEKVRETL